MATDEDEHFWVWTLGLSLAFAVLAGLIFWFGSSSWTNWVHAPRYADLSPLTHAGQLVWAGHLGPIYRTTPTEALPLSFIAMAPLTPILNHIHELGYYRNPATLIAGTYILTIGGIALLHAVRKLAWDLNMRTRLWILQLIAVVMVLMPEYEYGHFDDVLALALAIHAVRRLLRQDYLTAALLLGVATGFKQWAIMLLPLAAFSAPRSERLRVAFAGLAVPVALVVVALGVDGTSAFHAVTTAYVSNALLGHPGLSALWFGSGYAELARALSVVVAVGLGWKYRSESSPGRLLLIVSAVLVLRPLTDGVNYSYYWSPALLFLAFSAVAADPHKRSRQVALPMAALVWSIPSGRTSSPGRWWICELTLLGLAMALQTRDSLPRARPVPPAPEIPAVGSYGP